MAAEASRVRPEFRAPIMAQTPVCDGVLTEGEWPTTQIQGFVMGGDAEGLLQSRRGECWIGTDGKYLLVALRSVVHPRYGIVARRARSRAYDNDLAVVDDSFELWVVPDPESEKGLAYQMLVTSKGVIFDQRFDRFKEKADLPWTLRGLKHGSRVEQGVWTIELAVPLKELGIKDLDQAVGIRVVRNFQLPFNQSQLSPIRPKAFSDPESMSRIAFDAKAPVIRERVFPNASQPDPVVDILNPTGEAMTLTVRLDGGASNGSGVTRTVISLKPGESRRVEMKSDGEANPARVVLHSIRVEGKNGRLYHYRDLRWRVGDESTWEVVL